MAKKTSNSHAKWPNYITKRPSFSCPVSISVAWHWNLVYTQCPISADQRDMGACEKCHLKGNASVKTKSSKRKKSNKKERDYIPTIGTTYTSK